MRRVALVLFLILIAEPAASGAEPDRFRDRVAPILEAHCVRCHHPGQAKGGVDLSRASTVFEGDDPVVVANRPDASRLIEVISGDKPAMPKSGDRLGAAQVAELKAWVAEGAIWPKGVSLRHDPLNWWSLRPLARPEVPRSDARARTPVDAFILARLRSKGIEPSPEADRRTLIRRVTFDLIGLPPEPDEVDAFLLDGTADAYERVVDRLLASPRYGERWARHWLDVARYADTHGYDKDQPRPNAWPYRDYVIRAFNEDKPYGRFVREQVAGDVLDPGTRDGLEALGFIAAGPWDFIGHAEVPESKLDGQIARLLDRDEMVSSTLNAFNSLTVQCARCHDHKFDPVTQEDYYSLQAVFAALDRADKAYDADPEVARCRAEWISERTQLAGEVDRLRALAAKTAGEPLADLDRQIAEAEARKKRAERRSPAYGYHSGLASTPETIKWVQIDLGRPVAIARVVLHACDDDFNNIGEGFGFPTRFKVEASDDPEFREGVAVVADRSAEDFPNPRLAPVGFVFEKPARFVRVTATRLAARLNDYNFALAEVEVFGPTGANAAKAGKVAALDAIEAPPRWRLANLVDGDYPIGSAIDPADLKARRERLIVEAVGPAYDDTSRALAEVDRRISALPTQSRVYSGTVHHGSGAFRGTGPDGGKPRVIRVLRRGDVREPGAVVEAGTVPIIDGVPARFGLPPGAPEGERRAALARWLTDDRNPLTWRSIVNRVWLYHFGRGLVDSPNDFGRMGQSPTHPELLDWLAAEVRDSGQSLKKLHRLIVTSATYRQSSRVDDSKSKLDADNVLLWRMNRRKLEAEAVRDSVLMVAGRLDLRMGGPGFRDFVVEHPEHSPHYEYRLADVDDPSTRRRSVYRFIVRSQPQPFLTALDCADPSMSVDQRNQSTTALQSLALLNDRLMVAMASRFADRLESTPGGLPEQVDRGYRLALARSPEPQERDAVVDHARRFGLANACRLIFNLNEFVFID